MKIVLKFRSDLCFQDRSASWVPIVNGVEKYVSETTETIEDEEHRAFRETYCQSKTTNEVYNNPSLFFYMKECGWTSILEIMIRVLRGIKRNAPQFLGKLTEQWNLMILLKNSRRRKGSMVLCYGQLKIGYLFWPEEEEDKRKGFNFVWTLTLPDTFWISEQSKDILVVLLLILSCKTMYCYQKDLPNTSTTSGM